MPFRRAVELAGSRASASRLIQLNDAWEGNRGGLAVAIPEMNYLERWRDNGLLCG